MKTLAAVLFASLAVTAAACGDDPAAPPDDDANGGGTPQTGPERHWAQPELERMVTYLASDELQGRDEGTEGNAKARAFILAEYARCGIQPLEGSHEQPITTGAGINLLGVIPGSDPALAERNIILSAHYDHLGVVDGEIHNGADDNAAGVAVSIAIACAIAENPPKKSVIIANWDAEEPPTWQTDAMGSIFYVANPVVPLALTDAMFALDLIGADLWPGYPNHYLLGAELTPQLRAAVDAAPVPDGLIARRLGLHLVEEQPTGHQPWSDYDPFRNAGVPAVLVANAQAPHYHTPEDDITVINFPKLSLEAAWLHAIVQNIANTPEPSVFDPNGSDYLTDALNAKEVLTAAVGPGGMIESMGLTADSRAKLEADLANVSAIYDALSGGAVPNATQIRQLRDGAQRMMCYTSPYYPESLCNLF